MTTKRSVTREMRNMVKDQQIRKNILSMYREYDEDFECDVIIINFKENTMVNTYDWKISNSTGVTLSETDRFSEEYIINDWLTEVYMPLAYCTAEDQQELLRRV